VSTRQIVIDVPDEVFLAENTDEVSFGRELCMMAAAKLYELGRLSSGRAAELAGVSRAEFLLNLGRYQVFPFQAELSDLETHHA
jgi:predicted HTH domain antitoxin